MDSPKPTTTTTSPPLSSIYPLVQESPFTNSANKLSPIEPAKAPNTVQGLDRLNSPPLVFTSTCISTHHESFFLKRPEDLPSENEETPLHESQDNSIEKNCDVPDDIEKSVSKLINNVLHDDAKNLEQVQHSGCVDKYLADPLELDCANSVYSSNSVAQSPLNCSTGLKKITLESDNNDDSRMNIIEPLPLSEKVHEQYLEKSVTNVQSVKIGIEQRGGDRTCPSTDAELSADHVIDNQQSISLCAENAGGGHGDEYDHSHGFRCGSLRIISTLEHCEDVEEISNEPVSERMRDQEASENHRGLSRRCLQFEDSQPKTAIKTSCSSNQANNESADFGSLSSSNADLSATARNREQFNSLAPPFPPCRGGKSPLPVSKPLGIGLHLNSIFNTVTIVGHETPIVIQQINTVPNMASHTEENLNNCSKLPYTSRKVSISVEDEISPTTITNTNSSASGSIQNVINLTLQNKRGFSNVENADTIEDWDHHSPQKKRKKLSSTNDGDGCKHCNCKKSKCLKLYCDCFAAGLYCGGSCSCQGCFNKPEYQDIIQEAKQQIESRNPAAFAPKVVHCITPLAAASEERRNQYTPSARHKRGCNCKKSKCLKKYCECYQANVGCSIGCWCEGCDNVHGRKEEYIATLELVNNSISGSTFDERLEIESSRKVISLADDHQSPNLTPLTPSFAYSDHGKDASKSRFISRTYLLSPAYDNSEILESNKEALDGGSYSQKTDDDVLDIDQFLPRFDPLAGIPNPNPPPLAIESSVSSKNKTRKSGSLIHLGPGSCCLSSGGSLRWRSSPATPLTRLCENKNLEGPESDILDDDTPEVLKDSSTPTKSVKVTSPNGKRVSPPRIPEHKLGSSSSGPLKSSRRFILKAVAFPPLTPCIGSKDNELQEKRNDR